MGASSMEYEMHDSISPVNRNPSGTVGSSERQRRILLRGLPWEAKKTDVLEVCLYVF